MDIIELYLEDVEILRQRIIGGTIYFKVNDEYFPQEHWYDAITTDLEEWLPRLLSFARSITDTCLLRFLDGPCCVQLKRHRNGIVSAACFWDNKVAAAVPDVDFSCFLESVVRSLRKYYRVLREQEIPFPYAEALSALTDVKKQLKKHS